MDDRTDRERIAREAIRIGRIVWRHTPPLRSAVEKDDWLQEAVVCCLQIDNPDDDTVKRALRALAKKMLRHAARQVKTVPMPGGFAEWPASGPIPLPGLRIDTGHLPVSHRRRGATYRGRRIRITGRLIYNCMAKGASVNEIATRLGTTVQNVHYWLKKLRRIGHS
ncbi:MAG: helix-turn-helix transcriptional regulator [Planctomycetes bacterium]|nr:helix-turn-helix transcriptional regulator [Planctomycetota bacterium]